MEKEKYYTPENSSLKSSLENSFQVDWDRRHISDEWNSNGKLTSKAAHELLDDIIELQRLSGDPTQTNAAAKEALVRAQALLEGVAQWAFDHLKMPEVSDPYFAEIVKERSSKRFHIVDSIIKAPSLIPKRDQQELLAALIMLDEGQVSSIFEPLPQLGRGREPNAARQAEENMLMWIEFKSAQGMKKAEAYQKVADAVGRSVKAVEKWMALYKENEGERSAEHKIKTFRKAGNFIANGQEDTSGLSQIFSDWSLEQLAAEWKMAKKNR